MAVVSRCFVVLVACACACLAGRAQASAPATQDVARVRQVSFREAVERAMAFGVQASTSLEDVAAASAASRGVRAAASPNVYLSATYTRLDHARVLAGRTLSGRDQVNGFVGINQALLAPRVWGNLREAHGQERVAWAAHRNARRNAALDAAYAYLDVVVARRGVDVVRSASATDSAHLNIARARLKAGIANRLDALRAEDELAQSDAQLAASLAALSRSQEQLGLRLGLDEAVDAADDAALLAPTVADRQADGQAGDGPTLHHRADYVFRQRALRQAQDIRRHSWLDLMPAILATGQLFSQDPPTPQNPRVGWSVQVLASVPLWDGGSRRALLQGRRAEERKALLQLDALERQAHSEVRTAVSVLKKVEEQLLQAGRSANAASESVGLTSRAYRGGALGNLEVVDAERRNRDAQIRKATAEDAVRRARLDLVVAAGKFPELP